MSLIQFLQQTIIKDVSHQMLQEIQNQHSTAQSLLDTLSSLRQLNKIPILQIKMTKANEYLEIKQEIFRCMNSLDDSSLDRWVNTIFKNNALVSEFIKIERTKIEAMIINAIRQIFAPNMRSSYEQNQQNKAINSYIFMLNQLKNGQLQDKKPSRQQVIQISNLDQKFQQYLLKFQEKVNKFNKYVQQYITKLKIYEEKVKRQFRQLINFEPTKNIRNNDQTPLKQLQDQQQYNNGYDNEYDDYYRPQARLTFDSRYELPTRDIAYPFDTI